MVHASLIRRLALATLVAASVLFAATLHRAAADTTTSAAISAMLAEAHAKGCKMPADVLSRVLCSGRLRVGVNANYPGFGVQEHMIFKGYDVDVGEQIAHRLGVLMQPIVVTPGNRMSLADSGAADAIIAAVAISVTRQAEVNFVQPAYYQSHTSVIGPRLSRQQPGASIAGRTVCVTPGNVSNTLLGAQGARLMLFGQGRQLVDALQLGRCVLAAHDDTFFAASLTDRASAAAFEEKLSLMPAPWGIVVPRHGAEDFARLLSLIITDMHQSGTLIAIARKSHVSEEILQNRRATWLKPECILPDGGPAPACMATPVQDADSPSEIAPAVVAMEAWLAAHPGIHADFSMLKGQQALRQFTAGVLNTIVLIAGATAATPAFAALFFTGMRHRRAPVAAAARLLVTLLQSSPLMLLLFLGYLMTTATSLLGPGIALATAILIVGVANGSNAGAAMADTARILSMQNPAGQPGLKEVLRHSGPALSGFTVNAARASAAAGFIGIPELVNTLTNIASITGELRTTYIVMMLSYLALVMAVTWLVGRAARSLTFGSAMA